MTNPANPERRELDWRLVLLTVLVVSALYVRWRLGRGWMPYDDGAMAQSAERLNQGQLPHRDFDEVYTGGLTWLNAMAFRVIGTNLWTLRLVLFGVFVTWVPAVFYIASRFTRPLGAASMTLLAVVWSVPNYPAAMPSWYNLFMATFGVAALMRYLEDGRSRWLVAAGVAGGLSFLVKVIGLYFVAGALLFLVFHAHVEYRASESADRQRALAYPIFVTLSLIVFVGELWSVTRRGFSWPQTVVQYFIPGMLIAALLVRNEWTERAGSDRARFVTLARMLTPFLAGVAAPVAIFLVPYLRAGAVGAFINGVFVLPIRRFDYAAHPALPLVTMLALLPIVAIGVAVHRTRGGVQRRDAIVLAVALGLLLVATGSVAQLYRGVWQAARALPPVLAVIGVILLSRPREADGRSPRLREQTMLLLSVTSLTSLVQFPYSATNYFCYVAPLVALTALALHAYAKPRAGPLPGLFVAFFIAFAVLRMNSTALQNMGIRALPHFPMSPLTLERGGIEVPTPHAAAYEELVPLLRKHARGGYTWASPDAPEIYFLSGLGNPTRALFDFFQDSTNEAQILRAIDTHGVTAVVLNSRPAFSKGVSQPMYEQLVSRFPKGKIISPFVVLWKE